MKFSRVIAVIIVLAIVIQGYLLITKKKNDQPNPQNGSSQESQQSSQQVEPPVNNVAEPVSITKIGKNEVRYIEGLGTVKASQQTKILPIVSGQVAKVYVNEGDAVKAGDVLFEIGGYNGGKAVAQSQLEIAAANYQSAKENLENTNAANESALRVAQLQLQSAQHQAMGSYLDLQVFDHSIDLADYGAYLLQNSVDVNQNKTTLDLQKIQMALVQLQDGINKLLQQREQLASLGQSQIDAMSPGAEKTKAQQDLSSQIAQLDAKINDLNSQMANTQLGYSSADQALIMGQNQLLGQWAQSQNQTEILPLNRQSMQYKLGLYDGSSDPVRLAEEGLSAMEIKNATTLTQVTSAVKIAKANYDMAKMQADGLKVKAPIDGIIGELMVHEGDQVAPQVLLTNITGGDSFELKVAIDSNSAEKVKWDLMAEVMIGGRFIKVPIRNVAASADPTTRLVNVTVALPKIFFRNNQSLRVRIPLGTSAGAEGENLYVPLDAVIIGTEEQYVFVVRDGKAVKTSLKLGTIEGDQAQVLEGLSEDDEVVVDGAKNLIDGQVLLIINY